MNIFIGILITYDCLQEEILIGKHASYREGKSGGLVLTCYLDPIHKLVNCK